MIEGGMSPVCRLSTSPPSFPLSESHEEAQARPLNTFLSSYQPSSSQDQKVDDRNGRGPSHPKPESSVAGRVRGSSDSHFLASDDGDGWCGDNYGMGWMSSKMRFIQKMKNYNDPNHLTGPTTNDSKTIRNVIRSDDGVAVIMNGDGGGNHVTRVCSDCNTTTTPLWRSGPRGPKSLCNACGIRQRKARRAMEEAAATAGGFDPSSSSVTSRINGSKVHNKEKKTRGAGHSVLRPTCKKTTNTGGGGGEGLFGDFSVWRGTFPRDVTEAAILLMDLSCGFTHTRKRISPF